MSEPTISESAEYTFDNYEMAVKVVAVMSAKIDALNDKLTALTEEYDQEHARAVEHYRWFQNSESAIQSRTEERDALLSKTGFDGAQIAELQSTVDTLRAELEKARQLNPLTYREPPGVAVYIFNEEDGE